MDFAKSERKVLEVLSTFKWAGAHSSRKAALCSIESLTQGEISKLAKMPKRTVRFAVLKLKEKRMLSEYLHADARMSTYQVSGRFL